jgi:hypothetical protein
MPQVYVLRRLLYGTKKFEVITPSGQKIRFGAQAYDDYTTHRDKERLRRYIARHSARESWSNPNTAGFWSRWLLWNKQSIPAAIRDIQARFRITIRVAPSVIKD